MVEGLLGKKLGMTQIFDGEGMRIPVTVLEVGPCKVVQVRTKQGNGYDAVQLGFGKKNAKRVNKAERGHFKKAEAVPAVRLREFKLSGDAAPTPGQDIDVGIFKEGELVDIAGVTKGKGFAGVVRRYKHKGGPATHGSTSHRAPGAIGCREFPGKIHKGKRMPGHMGAIRVTIQKIKVVRVDSKNNYLVVKGQVPGPNGGFVEVIKSRKVTKK